MKVADVPNEFCSTYSRVTLAPKDDKMTKRMVFTNEVKYECLCVSPANRTSISEGLCIKDDDVQLAPN